MQRMKELVALLNRYAKQYYEDDNPTVSDTEYDTLYDELIKLEKATGTVLPDSPTHRVGGQPIKRFKQHTHLQRLYSLDKAQDDNQLQAYFQRLRKLLGFVPPMTLENKFDGLTLSLTYKNGDLVVGSTRGDGIIGEDVTTQIKTIHTVPLKIPYKGIIEIQGEVIMRLSVFKQYNKTATDPLKNARNAAAGAVRNLDPKVTAQRKLDFMAYNIGYSDKNFVSQKDIRQFLKDNNFQVDDLFFIIEDTSYVYKHLKAIEETREELDFLIDGAVLKVDELALRQELGFTQKSPRWAIAYKFMAEETTTIIKDVVWQISRTGKLNPLAILEPVQLLGATVQRATLNNIMDIRRKDIKINSRVFIRRSNDVIPEIMGVAEHYKHSTDIIPPTTCPACGGRVIQDNVFLYCENPENCAQRNISAIVHFASKSGMDIEGLSEKTAEQLYNDLQTTSIEKLYSLTKAELLTLDGFKERKANNLLSSIERSKLTTLDRFIYALGIPTIGKKAAQELAEKFGTFDNLLRATKDEIIEIDDFGEVMAENILGYFNKEENQDIISKLFNKGITFKQIEKIEGAFSGKTVVLTGSLEHYTRGQATILIESLGGKISTTVSKSVNLVIAGQKAGSKLNKAKELGIEIQDEQWLIDKLSNV